MSKSLPVNVGRNIAVRATLEKAFEVLELVKDPLELWCIVDLAPEVRSFYPANDEKLINLALGPVTRNWRVQFLMDHMLISLDGTSTVKLPYHAIYCIVADGSHAKALNWVRCKEDGVDIAHINLVAPHHGIPKYAR